MKKLMLSAAALAVALIGFGTLSVSTTQANPSKIWVINANVSATIATTPVAPSAFIAAMTGTDVTRAPYLTQLDAFQTASHGQVAQSAAISAFSGQTLIVVQTDGSGSPLTLNGRGLVCGTAAVAASTITGNTVDPTVITTAAAHGLVAGNQVTITGSNSTPPINGTFTVAAVPAPTATTFALVGAPVVTVAGTLGLVTPVQTSTCDAVATVIPNATDHIAVYPVVSAGAHLTNDTLVVTAVQDAISLDSSTITVVGQANNIQLVAVKTTIQEGLAAASCLTTSDLTDPARSGAAAIYTDINGVALVGYLTLWASSAPSTMVVAVTDPLYTPSELLSDGKTVAAGNVFCGVAAGTANLTAKNKDPLAITGQTSSTIRTQAITVTGLPAKIDLTAAPSAISCDGVNSATVTAKVTDSAGNNVVDNTPVTFSVVALGTANPIQAKTAGGSATSVITPLSVSTAGTTVIVTAGPIQASTRVDCALPVPTAIPAGASPTPRGGIGGPDTGTGGYLNQNDASGFPMWTLLALMLGSVTLVVGGLVTRRAGK